MKEKKKTRARSFFSPSAQISSFFPSPHRPLPGPRPATRAPEARHRSAGGATVLPLAA
jgi:hypothetical protein